MDIQQLAYFSKVAEFQNISKAAEVLYVTQPALTRTIKKLEEELDCKLFYRQGKSIVLTENGKLLQDRARVLLQTMRNVKDEVSSLNREKKAVVTIELRCIFGLFFDILGEYLSERDDIEFHIHQDDDTGINNGDYDLFIYPSTEPIDSRSNRVLFKEEVFVALAAGDPLAGKEVLTREELADRPYVGIGDKRYFFRSTSKWRGDTQFPKEISLYCDGMAAVRNMVRDKGYISRIPQYTWPEKDLEGIVLRPLKDERYYRYICMTWNADVYMSQAVKQFQSYFLRGLENRGFTMENE